MGIETPLLFSQQKMEISNTPWLKRKREIDRKRKGKSPIVNEPYSNQILYLELDFKTLFF